MTWVCSIDGTEVANQYESACPHRWTMYRRKEAEK